MVETYDRQVAFFRMPKTASMFIGSMITKTNRILTDSQIGIILHRHLYNSRLEIAACNSKGIKVFCFVRNPFARLVSAYNYIKKGGAGYGPDVIMQKILLEQGGFDNFCINIATFSTHKTAVHFYPQHKWIYRNGKCMVDRIGRYENLRSDYEDISEELSFPFVWKDSVDSSYLSQRQDYKSYYTDTTVRAILDFYKEDFELFGYEGGI